VLSKERNPVVAARCTKLGLEYLQGQDEKLEQLQRIASERELEATQVAYVGNDVNDLECMAWVGVAIAVADAEAAVSAAADWVTARKGGYGAVREVCDHLLLALQERDS
jgi:N-acylneuraminate cytidylyltransferase